MPGRNTSSLLPAAVISVSAAVCASSAAVVMHETRAQQLPTLIPQLIVRVDQTPLLLRATLADPDTSSVASVDEGGGPVFPPEMRDDDSGQHDAEPPAQPATITQNGGPLP